MLKKLFVHEWKDCWKLMSVVNAIVIAVSILGLLIFGSKAWQNIGDNTLAGISRVLYFMIYVISVGALSFVVSLYFYIRYFNNLYTDQGYLMHTLPVTANQLVWSKLLVAVAWHVISAVVVMLSVFTVICSFIGGLEQLNLIQAMRDLIVELDIPMTGTLIVLIIEFFALIVLGGFLNIFLGYTAISVGQLMKKQKILGAIGAYIVIYILVQAISSYATIPVTYFMEQVADSESLMPVIALLFIVGVVTALIDVALFYVNTYIMKNKLNLE